MVVRRVERRFCATIICGPEYGWWVRKMWSWVLLVRPSKRRFIARRERPQRLLFLLEEDDERGFLEDDGWCRVKTATPAVTSATTRYL